ncbi:MAG: hypothetical protein JSS98_11400 [Bacteroidetes bacterium]|nr:hypothetical protein [Bacteroidota bacterium]
MTVGLIGKLFLCIAIASGFFFYKSLPGKWLKILVWFLLFTFLMQEAGYWYSIYFKKSNHFIYNIYLLTQFVMYLLLFYHSIQQKTIKSFILWMLAFFVGYYTYQLFSASGIFVFLANANLVGSIATIACCLLYLVTLFQSEKIINYFQLPMFWITTGLLFYFTGNFLYLGLIDYISKNHLDTDGHIYLYMIVILNCLLYGLISIGFLSHRIWKNKM